MSVLRDAGVAVGGACERDRGDLRNQVGFRSHSADPKCEEVVLDDPVGCWHGRVFASPTDSHAES